MITIDGEDYLNVQESIDYLKPFVPSVTADILRMTAQAHGIKKYEQMIAGNRRYYKKSDLDRMKAMRPVEREQREQGHRNRESDDEPERLEA